MSEASASKANVHPFSENVSTLAQVCSLAKFLDGGPCKTVIYALLSYYTFLELNVIKFMMLQER